MLHIGTVGTSAIMRVVQEALRQTEGMQCEVVYSRTPETGRRFADSVGVAEVCCDFDALVRRPELDVICIASPNRFHAAQAVAALEQGKHVIVEKPAAVTEAEVERMAAAARGQRSFLLRGHHHAVHAPVPGLSRPVAPAGKAPFGGALLCSVFLQV